MYFKQDYEVLMIFLLLFSHNLVVGFDILQYSRGRWVQVEVACASMGHKIKQNQWHVVKIIMRT